MKKLIENLDESDKSSRVNMEVVCLDILYEDDKKQKGIVTDKGKGKAKYQIGKDSSIDYMEITNEYEIKNIEVAQVGDEAPDELDAFLLVRSDTEINQI